MNIIKGEKPNEKLDKEAGGSGRKCGGVDYTGFGGSAKGECGYQPGDLFSNINDISDTTANVTLYLYEKDGTPLEVSGSDITPGTPNSIDPNATVQYFVSFGDESSSVSFESCSARPAYGKIVVNSNNGQLLASGEMSSMRNLPQATPGHYEMYSDSTVTVNDGKPF